MLSRPFALGLVVVACVVAAGGGAYIATLQHARSDSAMAASPGFESARPAQAQSPATPAPATPAPSSPAVGAPPAQPSPDDGVTSGAARESGKTPSKAPQRSVPPPPSSPRSSTADARRPAEWREIAAPSATEGGSQKSAGAAAGSPQAAPLPTMADVPPLKEPPRAEPEKVWHELSVPADSVIGLQLETPLSSDNARVEDRVDARVTRDVRVDGQVAIPAGAHAIGSVMLVERGGKIRDRSRIGIRFNTLILPDATRLSVNTDVVFREGESPSASSSAKIGGGTIGGAILGTILGGGKGAAIGAGIGAAGGTAAAMAGDRRPVVLPVGTPLTVRTQVPFTVTVEK